MDYLHAALLIAAGALVIAKFIVAKTPHLEARLEQLLPLQVFVGVGVLVLGATRLLQVGPIQVFRPLTVVPLVTITMVCATWVAIVLGVSLGIPEVVRAKLPRPLVPVQMVFGVLCFGAGVLVLLFELRLLQPM